MRELIKIVGDEISQKERSFETLYNIGCSLFRYVYEFRQQMSEFA